MRAKFLADDHSQSQESGGDGCVLPARSLTVVAASDYGMSLFYGPRSLWIAVVDLRVGELGDLWDVAAVREYPLPGGHDPR